MKDIIGANSAGAAPRAQWVTVDEDSEGQRLDNFLLRQLKGVPKTHVYRIIRSGEVRINKGRAAADARVQVGDVVRIPPVRVSERSEEKKQAMAAPASTSAVRQFPILYEDDSLLVVDKPAGVAVHGGSGVSFGVIEQLRMARPQARFLELVHRLDRETSGILLVAKKRSALKNLQDQFRARDTGKTYLAMVDGHWPRQKKVLDKPLHKYLVGAGAENGEGERRVRVVSRDDPDGMPSLTLVTIRQESPPTAVLPCTLLEVTIKTGRTHQIRVHLASEGCPILGDDKYGKFEQNRALTRGGPLPPLRRMFLHAWRLQCNHPATGERMQLQAELPPDLAAFANAATPSTQTAPSNIP